MSLEIFNIFGCLWMSSEIFNIFGCLWVSLDVFGCLWVSFMSLGVFKDRVLRDLLTIKYSGNFRSSFSSYVVYNIFYLPNTLIAVFTKPIIYQK
jgi:hypothetical protein